MRSLCALLTWGFAAIACAPSSSLGRPQASPGGAAGPSHDDMPTSEISSPAAQGVASPEPTGAWGTAHPVIVSRIAPNRQWVAVCQARRDTNGDERISVTLGAQGELTGDALDGFLLTGPGPGQPIDAFVGSDPTGRHVAYVRGGHLILRDMIGGGSTDLSALGADIRDDQSSFLDHRAASFDPTGRRMLYFRPTKAGAVIVVRVLASGEESLVWPGPGELWRADFDMTGEHVLARVVVADTNKNGKLDWSTWPATGQHMRCPGPLPVFPAWEFPGDRAMTRIAPIAGGRAEDAPELITMVGRSRLERQADGALFWRWPDGNKVLLAPAKCESRILHADPKRKLVVLTCRRKNGRHLVLLSGPGYSQSFGIEMVSNGSDRWFAGSPRLIGVHAGHDGSLVDMERRKLIPLAPDTQVVATNDERALVIHENKLSFVGVHGQITGLEGRVDTFARYFARSGVVALTPFVIDLTNASVRGVVPDDVLGISSDGYALRAVGAPSDASKLAMGPLTWTAPGETPHEPAP